MADHANRLERIVNRRIVERKLGFQGYCPSPFVDAMLSNAKVLPGGRVLERPIASTAVDRTTFFSSTFGSGATWTPSANDIPNNFAMAKWEWKRFFTPVVIDEIEAAMAGSEEAVANYMDIMLTLPSRDHKQKVARRLARGAGGTLDFEGVLTAINDDGDETYAGLKRRYFPNLIGTVVDGSDVAGTTNTLGGNTVESFESSNKLVCAGSNQTSNATRGKEIVLTKSGEDSEIRVIVYSELVGSDTHIYVDRPLEVAVSGWTATVRSKLYSVSRYGQPNAFQLSKLDRADQGTGGKAKTVITDQTGFNHLREAARLSSYGTTEAERKKIGFSGTHMAMMYNGKDVFLDDTFPSGTFVLTTLNKSQNQVGVDELDDEDTWYFSWLKGFDQMRFRRKDSIMNLFPGGALAVAASGYVLVNVAAFGSDKINGMAILKNVTG